MKMKIRFTNGSEIEISQEIANVLRDRIIEGCKDFQIFTNEYDNAFLFINLKEICAIV